MSRIIINNRTQLSDKDALETVYLAWNDNPTGITLLPSDYGVELLGLTAANAQSVQAAIQAEEAINKLGD